MTLLRYFLWLSLAVVLQVLLFNHLSLFGGIVLIYMVSLLKIPVEIRPSLQIVIAFLTGFVIDSFCNTPGMHAFSAITVMLVRMRVLRLFDNDPEYKNGSVNLNRFGLSVVFRYILTLVTFGAILLYGIEAFTLFNFTILLTKIVISVVLTMFIAIAIEFASLKKTAS